MVGAIQIGAMRVVRGLLIGRRCLCRCERVDPLACVPGLTRAIRHHSGEAGRGAARRLRPRRVPVGYGASASSAPSPAGFGSSPAASPASRSSSSSFSLSSWAWGV
jgi:hypothetical protein